MYRHQHLTRGQNNCRGIIRYAILPTFVITLLIAVALTAGAQNTPPSQLAITVSSQGLTPTTATVKAGTTLLTVTNQRTQERVTLRISNQSGELVREIALPDKATVWKTELDLSVGQYVITDTSNAAWSCQLTVEKS